MVDDQIEWETNTFSLPLRWYNEYSVHKQSDLVHMIFSVDLNKAIY